MEQNEMVIASKKGVTGTTLKIIAIVAMFIDHFAAIMLNDYLAMSIPPITAEDDMATVTGYYLANPHLAVISIVMIIMRIIGRFGFPLFAFLMVEGFTHTRSVKKYAINLLVFALISELPFNLGFASKLFYPGYQNVFVTLLLGLLCLWCINEFGEKKQWSEKLAPLFYVAAALIGAFACYILAQCEIVYMFIYPTTKVFIVAAIAGAVVGLIVMAIVGRKFDAATKNRFTFTVLPIIVFSMVAEVLMTDYAAHGVLTIVIMYLLRAKKTRAFGWGCALLTIMSFMEAAAFLMLIPVKRYNGERGMKMNKYFFYAFYPVHIGLLYLVTLLLGFTTFSLGF
ncbi:MAG: hypothetical protein E7296_06655 [Lachnospiraceae bacterium]|jgi:hypothetical protein|nr:hypothetical protein [Lachnospiraceae bacterium]